MMLRLVSPREELGKNINADEAAAMGAVYQAAALSKAFKVKPFVVRDAVIYPILVSFAMGPTPIASPSEISVHLNLPLFLIPRDRMPSLLPTESSLALHCIFSFLLCRWSSQGRWRRSLGFKA